MMKTAALRLTIIALTTLLAACQSQPQSTAEPAAKATPAAVSATASPTQIAATNSFDKWLGQWTGPEGTFLALARKGDKYAVQIQSLDGLQTYEGVAAANGIQFVRVGKMETIHAGEGRETGMKWLLDKKDCLIINSGEGFCRK